MAGRNTFAWNQLKPSIWSKQENEAFQKKKLYSLPPSTQGAWTLFYTIILKY